MKSFNRRNLDSEKENFNIRLSRARRVVEYVFCCLRGPVICPTRNDCYAGDLFDPTKDF